MRNNQPVTLAGKFQAKKGRAYMFACTLVYF